jgi:putative flippase GtrA
VGVVGLVADTAVLWLLLHGLGMNPYLAKIGSYLAAATVTWLLNRLYTFKSHSHHGLLRQWTVFLVANLAGFTANYATYAICITSIPLFSHYPLLANIPASLAGLVFNFIAAKRWVFK